MTNTQLPAELPPQQSTEASYEAPERVGTDIFASALVGLEVQHQASADAFAHNIFGLTGEDPAVVAKHVRRDELERNGIEFDEVGDHVPFDRDARAQELSEGANWDELIPLLGVTGLRRAVNRDRKHGVVEGQQRRPLQRRSDRADVGDVIPEPRSHVGKIRTYKGLIGLPVADNNVVYLDVRRASRDNHPTARPSRDVS